MAANPPKRLLLVDDEEDLLLLLALAAENTGKFLVQTAVDGEDALAKALAFRPDIAVIDGVMPKMDGFELCRSLRADRRTRLLTIVMLSAGEPVRGEARALAAGADRYVGKPFDTTALMRLLLALRRKPAQKTRP